jgi:putative endonuclease
MLGDAPLDCSGERSSRKVLRCAQNDIRKVRSALNENPLMIGEHKHLYVYYVYIMASQRRVLYVGVTNNLERRVFEHKTHAMKGYTETYNVTRLVYFEDYSDVRSAIDREKVIKGWLRSRKIALINSINPKWKDLSYGWYQIHRYEPLKVAIE